MSAFSFSAPARPLARRQMGLLCAALALGFLLAVGLCTWSASLFTVCGEVRADTLRLHVRAASDSVLDQTIKLRVRDAVLARAQQLYGSASSKEEALLCAARNLIQLQLAAQHALAGLRDAVPVRIQLVNMYFSTTRYPGFTLPAGRYDAVRIDLGEGPRYGKNWWCVLYPQLCLAACGGGYASAEETDLTIGNYIVRLRVVEWWQSLTCPREDRPLLAIG